MFGRPKTPQQAHRAREGAQRGGRRRHQDSGHRPRHHGGDGGRGAQARAAHCASCRAWRKPTPGTTSSSAPPASSTGTAFPTPPSKTACRISLRAITTTTRPTVSATPAVSSVRPTPKRLTKVLKAMVDAHVAWDPTLDIYEASRDLQRAQTQPWFAGLSASHAGRIFPPESCQSWLVLHRLDFHGRDVLERELPHLDGGAARSSTASAA